jgi:hypothetical protein
MRTLSILITLIFLFFTPFYGSEILTLKSDTTDGEIYYPGKVDEGPSGKIYVADGEGYFIKIYSPAGVYLGRAGGKGEGPGLMKRMGSFGFSPDNKFLFFTEYFGGHRWITFCDLDGKLVKTFKLDISGIFGLRDAVMLPGERFIAQIGFSTDKVVKKSGFYQYYISTKLALINAKGEIETEIIAREQVNGVSMVTNGSAMTIPYRPGFNWVLSDGKIIFSDGLSNILTLFDYKGKKIGDIKTSLPEPVKVTKNDLENWRNAMKVLPEQKNGREAMEAYKRSRKVFDLYTESIYEKKPVVGDMSLTPADNILIAEYPCELFAINPTLRYWLINPEGKMLLEVKLKVDQVRITKNFIIFMTTDEDENTLVRYIKRQKSEKDDLLRLEKLLRI